MRETFLSISIRIVLVSLAWSCMPLKAAQPSPTIHLIPQPQEIQVGEGTFLFSPSTTIGVAHPSQQPVIQLFVDALRRDLGFTPKMVSTDQADIRIITDSSLADESYILDVDTKHITIRSAGNNGLFYAIQSLRQLMPTQSPWCVPAVTIKDSPRFGYRGVMIDVARFFTPKDHLLQIIDCMSMIKLNRLHLHLTDDNGWRIEIKRYPRLTSVGSKRVVRPGKFFPERRNPEPGEPVYEKGFYTQTDIREIVSYAAARQIEVIPEIDLPAHSNAALAAYPALKCPVVDQPTGVLPGLGVARAKIIFCAGNDSVYSFLHNVLDEVMELFPSHYIHIGGDEADKTYWKRCPRCQARMKHEHITNEEDLQGYFMSQLAQYIRSKGRKVIGWDELTNSQTLPEGAVIFGWRGMGQAALKAARQGHPIVMTPAQKLYLIRYQGPQRFEPITYFGNNTLKDVYDYEPVQRDWTSAITQQLLGIQGSLWTEFCQTTADVDYLLFPRMLALAETAWTMPVHKDWNRFLKATDNYCEQLGNMGIVPARSMFNIQESVVPHNGKLQVALDCIRPDVQIRYTLDGTPPSPTSPLYTSPLEVSTDVTIQTATFCDNHQEGETLSFPIHWNKATACPIKTMGATLPYTLTNGVRGTMKCTDSEWCSWNNTDSASFIIDLQRIQPIKYIRLGCINNYGVAVHRPAQIDVLASKDGRKFRPIATYQCDEADLFADGTFREDLSFAFQSKARYVKIQVRGAGICPPSHVRPGQKSRFFFDEVIVE